VSQQAKRKGENDAHRQREKSIQGDWGFKIVGSVGFNRPDNQYSVKGEEARLGQLNFQFSHKGGSGGGFIRSGNMVGCHFLRKPGSMSGSE